MTSLWHSDTIKDVAEAVGIANLSDDVAKNLAMDVEYRIHQVLQEALKFMKHAKRTVLTTQDISHALRVLDIEPLYGYDTTRPVRFGEASLGPGQPMFYVEDDEVDFEKLVNAPLPKVPREVSMTAHWLAIEGVQPAIPQNPTPQESRAETTSKGSLTNSSVAALGSAENATVKPLVKHILSKELQLYFEKVCGAVLDESNEPLRAAAFSSLRHDPGLHQLLPYFVQFVSEKVTHGLKNLFTLSMMMQFTWAILENEHLFIEPYVSSIVPPVLTCLIGKRLGDPAIAAHQNPPAHFELRDLSASLIALLCRRFGDSTHTLKPRLTRTCLKAFLDPSKPPGTHYGAIAGLHAIGGKESVRVLIIPNLTLYETVLKEGLSSEDEMKKVEAEMVLAVIVKVLRSLEEDARLIVGCWGDEMEITNGDGQEGEGVGEVLKKRLVNKVGEVVAEEVCKLDKRGLVKAILDSGGISLR
ncbi:hypothetical protein BDZ91DRAFT_721234 [Kalaharituber pfeilii]|nr:hypothetical protein BDZ91DRAFT_721234 [Kalaharituber pfeilii]